MKKHLVIFVKAPRMGRIKTRLAKDIGNFNAWRFYRSTVNGLIKRVGQGKWDTVICVSPDNYKGSFFDSRYKATSQGGGDLGKRMQRVFDDMPKGKIVLIGGDIPSIEKHHITRAFEALKNNQVVFGPADDGGFWLVGMRRARNRITPFVNVSWSSADTMKETAANIKPNVRVAYVDRLNDVDTAADLSK